MGEQRQRGRLTFHLTDEQVDQAGLETQPGATGRPLDRASQANLAQRAEQIHPVLEGPRDLLIRREVTQVVGAE